MNKEWFQCDTCAAEFHILSPMHDPISYCPYCGDDIVLDEEDEEDDLFE